MIEPTQENINTLLYAVETFEKAFLNSIALATEDYRMSPIFYDKKLSYDNIEAIYKRANMTEWDESQCLLDVLCEGYEHLYKIDLNAVIDSCEEEFKKELGADRELPEITFWSMEEASYSGLNTEEAVYEYIQNSESIYNKDDEIKLQKMIFDKIKQLKEVEHAEE